MNVMLLAAGEGTRLRPHTLVLPKPAIPFLNLPLAAYPLAFLGNTPVDKLVVNTFHLPDQIVSLFKDLKHGARELHFSHEKKEILGSGGGLKKAQDLIGKNDFIMMNADEVIIPNDSEVMQKAIESHRQASAIATLIVMKHDKVGTQFGGVWTNKKRVLGFGKEAISNSTEAWHFIGVQILSPKVFDYLPAHGASNILYDGLTQAIQAGETVQIHAIECQWFETGNEKDFIEASSACLEHIAQKNIRGKYLESIFKRFDLKNTMLERDGGFCLCAQAVDLNSGVKISGYNSVGTGSSIPAKSELKNSVIGSSLRPNQPVQLDHQLVLKF